MNVIASRTWDDVLQAKERRIELSMHCMLPTFRQDCPRGAGQLCLFNGFLQQSVRSKPASRLLESGFGG